MKAVLGMAAAMLAVMPPAAADDLERATTWPQAAPGEAVKACPQPVWPAASREQRVLVLGDSLTRYAYAPLRSRLTRDGWAPTIICWGGMQTDWGMKQVADVQRRRYVPDRVVVAFGTNDVHKNPCYTAKSCARQVAVFGRRVEQMLTMLGPEREVWWLNIDMDAKRAAKALNEPWNRYYPAFNAELARVLAGHPNARIIDWRSTVRSNRERISYTWDGLHYAPIERPRKSVGTMLRVETIARVLKSSDRFVATERTASERHP